MHSEVCPYPTTLDVASGGQTTPFSGLLMIKEYNLQCSAYREVGGAYWQAHSCKDLQVGSS